MGTVQMGTVERRDDSRAPAGAVRVDDQTRASGLRTWAWGALVFLGLIGALWLWAGVTPQADSGSIEASGDDAAAVRDDGLTWRVTRFQPGRRAEVRFEVQRRGPLPVSVRDVPAIENGPPVAAYCGWWPDRLLIDGEELADRDSPYPLPRTGTTDVILSGAFLGEPGCMDADRIGARRIVAMNLSLAGGAPKNVRLALPEVLAWSPSPQPAAQRLADRSTRPRVGTAP